MVSDFLIRVLSPGPTLHLIHSKNFGATGDRNPDLPQAFKVVYMQSGRFTTKP